MKNGINWETSYAFDFVIPTLVEKYKLDHFSYSTGKLRGIEIIDIMQLQKFLKQDHEYMCSCPQNIVNLFFGGDEEMFIQAEADDYRYIINVLDCAAKSIHKDGNLSLADEAFIRTLYFRKATTVYDRAWYFLKRVNFSRETLSSVLPKFASILYSEEYISTNEYFKRLEVVNELAPPVSVEDMINHDYLSYDFYYADELLLNGISNEIHDKENFEGFDFELMLKQAIEGKVLLCIFK